MKTWAGSHERQVETAWSARFPVPGLCPVRPPPACWCAASCYRGPQEARGDVYYPKVVRGFQALLCNSAGALRVCGVAILGAFQGALRVT